VGVVVGMLGLGDLLRTWVAVGVLCVVCLGR
jgi:hypothetical protein